MQAAQPNHPKLKLPVSYFVLQIAGALLWLPVFGYIRGGATRDMVVSLLPILAVQRWVWIEAIVGLVLIGLAGKVFFASVQKAKVEASKSG